MRKLFDGEPEFRIVEKIKDRLRSWVIPDVDGFIKELMVSRGGPYLKAGGWIHFDEVVEDGTLVTVKKSFNKCEGKNDLVIDNLVTFAKDWHGGSIRKLVWILPKADIKIRGLFFLILPLLLVVSEGGSFYLSPSPFARNLYLCICELFEGNRRD